MQPQLNHIYCGDAAVTLSDWPDSCIDCIVTSPPYYQQRNYPAGQQIGQEESLDQYIAGVLNVFRQACRVLRDCGSLWLVLGDKYEKGSLLGVPWRVALALQQVGWILRSDIIWHKPNAMPSAVTNRPTTDHEYIFLMTKLTSGYYYDADAIREPHVTFTPQSRMRGGRRHFFQRGSTPEQGKNRGSCNLHDARWDQAFHPQGRNKRTVWSVPLSKYRDAHFAVFPEALVETCIRAGCPPQGVVLDPFLGSGTVAVVARKLERSFLGIESVADYCEMARQRLSKHDSGIFVKPSGMDDG